MAIVELRLSMEVAAETMECDVYTPPSGKKFEVLIFQAEAAFNVNAAVALVWIHDHTTEAQDTLWSTKGSGHMGKPVTRTNADGVRKLSLCLDNGLTGPAFLSGYARILVED